MPDTPDPNASPWLPGLIGPLTLQNAGVPLTTAALTWNFTGITVSYDPSTGWMNFVAAAASTPTGTGFRKVVANVEDGTAQAIGLASADVTGVLARANGGTGLSAAGTSGNVLTSDGTNWTSAAPSGGLPTLGSAGEVLAVNDAATAAEWRNYVATDVAANVATNGVIRVGYDGTNPIPIISTLDNTGTTYNVVEMSGANNITIGNTAQNITISAFGGFSLSVTSGAVAIDYGAILQFNDGSGANQVFALDQNANALIGYTGQTTNGVCGLYFSKALTNPTSIGNTGFGIFADASTGAPKAIDSQNNILALGSIALSLAADFTGSTSTSAQATNLTVQAGASDIFDVEVEGNGSVSSGTSGLKVAIAAPTGAVVEGSATANTTAVTAQTTTEITAINTLVGTFFTVATTVLHFYIKARVKMDGTHSGAVTPEFASVGGVAFTIKKGTTMKVTRVIEV